MDHSKSASNVKIIDDYIKIIYSKKFKYTGKMRRNAITLKNSPQGKKHIRVIRKVDLLNVNDPLSHSALPILMRD
jgi:hypothetical protein